MIPGPPALCEGTVLHRRVLGAKHHFTYPVSQVWIDPDNPGQMCDLHPAWSHKYPMPARFRRHDYGVEPTGSLAAAAQNELGQQLGHRPQGPVRMLSQIRRWGWLFNPITMFFVWDSQPDRPVGVVLEVTNTPWKERKRYPLIFRSEGDSLVAEFDKELHVSPFLGMDYRYRLRVEDQDNSMAIDIDVIDQADDAVLHTSLRLGRIPATREVLGRSLRDQGFPTHRVSAGIHRQAARLRTKGVPFVSHPRRTATKKPLPVRPIKETA